MSVQGRRPVVTLLTDYGITDEFAGVLHGVIARLCPDARVINLTHGVVRHDIRGGAAVLAQSLPYMPVGVHLAVVDPTVGGDRRAVALRVADGRILVGPDNGLLWPAAELGGGVEEAAEISRSPWRLEPVSATFHGRDIFAPVTAQLAAGAPLEEAGEPLDPGLLVRLETPRAWTEAGALVATVNNADRFGNLQLGAGWDDIAGIGVGLGDLLQVRLPSGELHPATFARTFSDVPEGKLILFQDSAAKLALGFNQGSAAIRLGLRPGDQLRIGVERDS
ncbi:MAG TPA: SAM-dependent chlorinase/fluorinase [Solirubrobacteraceae bacterium]|nr:SAM-dependent chlorinase/fluorinase [Solirubrobacteraceae bacterium]